MKRVLARSEGNHPAERPATRPEVALPGFATRGKSFPARPPVRLPPGARPGGWHGGSGVNPSLARADHEELCPPRALRLAVPGSVRALARLCPASGLALGRQHQRGVPPPEDPLLQRELSEVGRRKDH